VEFFCGTPDPGLVSLVHAGGALAGWQVGSVAEARQAVDAGCDLIIAQGMEAGGHVRDAVAMLPLLAEVLEVVTVPVLAAGGIANARAVAAALAAGAAGVRVGTRFVATQESGAQPDYVAALLAATAEATVLTEAFSVGWPDAPHRVLRSALAAAQALPDKAVATVQTASGSQPIPRWFVATPSRAMTGHIEAMALYAGQGVGQVTRIVPAGQVVTELAEGPRGCCAAGVPVQAPDSPWTARSTPGVAAGHACQANTKTLCRHARHIRPTRFVRLWRRRRRLPCPSSLPSRRRPLRQVPMDGSLSSISHAWSSMCQAQRRIRNCNAHDRADSPRAWCSRIPSTKASR
jgi:hypothetical protein